MRSARPWLNLLFGTGFAVLPAGAWAAEEPPFLHALFSEHVVLQRAAAVPVWGWSTPGDKVHVTIGDRAADGEADADGRWQVSFGDLPPGGPYTLVAAGAAKNATVNDVLVGDVWLCSGQSNMEFTVSSADNAQAEIAAADLPQIRQFGGTRRFALAPQALTGGGWAVCTPGTVGRFTAVGFFFGRQLHRELKVPIGLIHASWGGTRIEAWMSAAGLAPTGRSGDELKQLAEKASGRNVDDFQAQMNAWWDRSSPSEGRERPEYDDRGWESVEQPAPWEDRGMPGFDGVAWFRRSFDVPAAVVGATANLRLGPVDDQDTTWINGLEVGRTGAWNQPRVYAFPPGVLKPGRNTIAIRVLDTGGGGGLIGKPEEMRLEVGGTVIPLAGPWRRQAGKALRDLPSTPSPFNNPNIVTSLSNGMIEPLTPYALRGALWYQGESNATPGSGYEVLLPALIADWRGRFHQPELPFGIVQLAGYKAPQNTPVEDSPWAEVRDAQLATALGVPRTGLAVAADIGDANDIHPRNKQEVARRLAQWALHDVYGQDVVRGGPLVAGVSVEGPTIRVRFSETAGGLVAKGDPKVMGGLAGFAIAAGDGPWLAADARIDGDSVVLSNAAVPNPAKARYAWANNPSCTLFNGAGLPASPFRTDK